MATNTKEKKEPKIRQYYKPDEKEEELISMVYDRFDSMKDNPKRQEAETEWNNAQKAWDQVQEDDENLEDWQADYFVPLTTGVVESALSEMLDQSPRPIILPRSNEDKAKATVMKHAFEYTWEIADGDEELENVLKDCLIYGNGFAQEFYWKDRRMIKKLKSVKKNGKKQSVEEYEEIETFDYDDCYMESVSPFELFFDETARTINRGPYKARDAIRRYVMKMDDAKLFFSGEIWDPLGNMRFVRPGGDTDWYSYYKPPEDVDKTEEVEVLWYWSRRPEDWLIIMINDVLIKASPNPYKHKQLPFAMTYDVKRPHQFFHKGEPKILESIQKELNTMRRMIADRNHLDIDKMWLVQRNETYSEDDVISRPHGMIRVDDPANYKPVEYGDIPQSVGLTLQELRRDSVTSTGIEVRTQDSKPAATATDAAIMQAALVKRIAAKLRRLEKGFLVDIGRMRVANIVQFYSQPKLERIIGEAGTKEYVDAVASAKKEGIYHEVDGVGFQERYKEIRVTGRELIPNERGTITEKPHPGYNFFKMKPDTFIPAARGGFDIRFEAGSTMPVSKPLMAKQTQDAVAMLMPLATAGIGYDPVKLGDDLLKSLDKDPENYHIESEEKDVASAQEEMTINMASQENEEVTKGNPIPPVGTPYATPAHTMIHISYMKSPQGKSMPQPYFELLTKHAMGEITAQQMRGGVAGSQGEGNSPTQINPSTGNQPPSTVVSPPSAPYNEEKKAALPGVVQGGEEVTGTQKGSLMTRVLGLMGRKR